MKAWLNPKWRIRFFLLALNLAWLVPAWLWLARENWLWLVPIALSINVLLLTYDQVLRFRTLSARPLLGQDTWGILKLVHELSEKLQVPEPKVFLIEQPSAQLFSYAKRRGSPRLFVTEGALDLLTLRQLRAVLIFQMMAIRSSYNVLNFWLAAWLDLLFRAGKGIERGFALAFGWAPPIAAWWIGPWLGVLKFFLIDRRDFHKLDRETAAQLENPEDLAFALMRMESYAQTRPWPEPWTLAHMCMVSPLRFQRVGTLLRVQPALESRIRRLAGRYPL
jgi:heat shock protein HtpX